MSTFSDLINDSFPEGVSNRELERRLNGRLSRSTINVYRKDGHGTPSDEIISAFHEALNIPLRKLREAAGLPTGENEPYSPPSEANLLNRRQRQAIDELIRSFVTTQAGAHNDFQGQASEITTNQTADSETSGGASRSRAPVTQLPTKQATRTNWREAEELAAREQTAFYDSEGNEITAEELAHMAKLNRDEAGNHERFD